MKINRYIRYSKVASSVDDENVGTSSALPSSLQRLVDETDEIEHEELLSRARNFTVNCLPITRLHQRRWWARLYDWSPSDQQLRRWTNFVFRADEFVCDALKLFVVLAAFYLILEILPAFLPGGTVDQMLGGAR